jgi:ubiquinone/menaquinone biosynthesis C-methylase UbiE
MGDAARAKAVARAPRHARLLSSIQSGQLHDHSTRTAQIARRLDWIRDYFERGYAQRWGLQPPSDQVRLEAGGLWDLLQLVPRARLVDIGCGHGRHAVALAERGSEVIGIDFAAALLSRAQGLAADLRVRARWVRGDMRRLPVRSACADAALLMDAFGFFETEAENEAVLCEAARVLTIGGRLGVKVVNGGPVLEAFRETDREERDGTVIAVSRTLTTGPPRMIERIHISGRRGAGEYERRQRLYRADEMRALVERAGLSIVGVYAKPDGSPFDSTSSSTMWIVGQQDGSDSRPGRRASHWMAFRTLVRCPEREAFSERSRSVRSTSRRRTRACLSRPCPRPTRVMSTSTGS